MCESNNQENDLHPVQTVVSPSRRGGEICEGHTEC